MKKFSAIVKDKYNNSKMVIIRDCEWRGTKASFIDNLRSNGYMVDVNKVKESSVFDYIMNYTDCNSWDWKIKKVPEGY